MLDVLDVLCYVDNLPSQARLSVRSVMSIIMTLGGKRGKIRSPFPADLAGRGCLAGTII